MFHPGPVVSQLSTLPHMPSNGPHPLKEPKSSMGIILTTCPSLTEREAAQSFQVDPPTHTHNQLCLGSNAISTRQDFS